MVQSCASSVVRVRARPVLDESRLRHCRRSSAKSTRALRIGVRAVLVLAHARPSRIATATGTFVPCRRLSWMRRGRLTAEMAARGQASCSTGCMPEHPRPILIVEDDPESRDFLVTLLTLEGYRVAAAANGEEALALARDERPGLILLDLGMPQMDGFAFRRAQLDDPMLANTPVILTSALNDESQIARRIGPMGAVPKPINIDTLLEQVALYCERVRS